MRGYDLRPFFVDVFSPFGLPFFVNHHVQQGRPEIIPDFPAELGEHVFREAQLPPDFLP